MVSDTDGGIVSISVTNLGGIDSEHLTFGPGVVALTGRNATNRTSLLQALVAALGGSDASLKADAEEGAVDLDIGGTTHHRRYRRDNGTVSADGEPFTDQDVLVDTFASLLKSNPVRRAIEQQDGEALHSVLMAPVDTAQIQSRVEAVQRELRATTDRTEEIERERERLPSLEERRAELESALADVRESLETVRTTVDAYEADSHDAEAAEAVMEALHEARSEREAIRDEQETQARAVQALEAERADVRSELETLDLPDVPLDEIEDELDDLQSRERRLANGVNSLLSIIEFNEDLLDGEAPLLLDGHDGTDPADGLDPDADTVECWTCGTTIHRTAVRAQLEDLRALAADRRTARADLAARIAERREERREYEASVERAESLRDRIDDIDDEMDDRNGRLETLGERMADCESRIGELEGRAADTEGLRDSDILAHHQQLSELEYERGQLDRDLRAVEQNLEGLAGLEEELASIEAERDGLREELSSLRSRIESIEQAVVETFNEHASTVIELLDYENIERIWIERKAGGSGASQSAETTFDLHVVRSAGDGTVVEDSLAHLSESERELVGLTVALAGYLAHDVHDVVPIMVLDSLEAIDAGRIAALVDHFADFVPYLVVALLPEDAAALADEYARVDMAPA